MERRERIRKLLRQMAAGIYERDHVLALALLTAIAGESLFLLGLPGVGKSLVARRLKLAFRNARSFEYLMSRFSTPDEIFGPVSISKLKDCDIYERKTDGYLPTADIVFLDEIWKAGPAIQNTLLTVLNEKLFRNGNQEMSLPLKSIVAASNELPARDEGLEALWDRFLLRIVIPPLESEKLFTRMIIKTEEAVTTVSSDLQITADEYAAWQAAIGAIFVGEDIVELIARIRTMLKQGIANEEKQGNKPIYVSDRRWKKIVHTMRTAAFLNGREQVDPVDGFIIAYAIWNDTEQIEELIGTVNRIVTMFIIEQFDSEYTTIAEEWEMVKAEAIRKAGRNRQFVSDFRIVDNQYYNIVGYTDGDTLISIEAYNSLRPYADTRAAFAKFRNRNASVISTASTVPAKVADVLLKKKRGAVQIGDSVYPLERVKDSGLQKVYPEAPKLLEGLNDRLDRLSERIGQYLRTELALNGQSPFMSEAQANMLRSELLRLLLRIRKLRNNLFHITTDA